MKRVIILLMVFGFTSFNSNAQNSFNDIGESFNSEFKTPIQSDVFSSLALKLNNPCEDSLYVELKKKSLDEMSDREYEVFKQKDKACNEYLNTVRNTEAQKQNAETLEKANNAATTYYVIAGIATLVSVIYLFTL